MSFKNRRVIIVGAGIVGTSLAYHLAHQNAHVTLIDEAPQPGHGVTDKSFAWIVAAHDAPEIYMNLLQQAITDWHRIEDEFNGKLKVNWSGALTWHKQTDDTERIARKLLNFNYRVRLVDKKEIRLLEPNLKHVPDLAMFAESEGAIDPGQTAELFVKAAREAGTDIQLGNKVLSFITHRSRVTEVVTVNGNLRADIVVLAAGAGTTKLCQPLGLTLPVNASPAILMHFQNDHQFVNRIVSNPFMEIRAASNTLTLAAEDYIDDSVENNPQVIANRTLKNIKKSWNGTEHIKLINVVVGKRPMPQDGLPIIGRTTHIDNLYLLVMHTGITLAAVVGRLAAAEILSDQDNILLSPYRLERFDTITKRN